MRPFGHASTRYLILGLAAGLALTGCAGAPSPSKAPDASAPAKPYSVSLTNCGMDIKLDKAPSRAVALNQGMIEESLSVGAAKQMVGTAYLDNPVAPKLKADYDSVPVLSPDAYPSKEKFLEARPDFAMSSYASAFGDKGVGSREELKASGITTYIDPFGCPNKADRPEATFENVWKGLSEVGAIFGRDDEASKIVGDQKAKLAQLKSEAAGKGKKVVWWDSGSATPSVGGHSGGPALVMDAVGATNAFDSVQGAWGKVSWEQVVAADPDVIVTIEASWDQAAQKLAYLQKDPVLQNLRAVKNKKIVTVSFSEGTPGVSLIDGATHLAQELKKLPA